MTSILPPTVRWLQGARRARRAFVLTVLSLVAACAPATTTRHDAALHVGDASASKDADRVLWVRAVEPGARAQIVLTGADVRLVSGQRAQRGDTLYAIAPFAVELPDDAFELQIETLRPAAGRGAAHGAPMARVEYATRDQFGEVASVRAEGSSLLLARPAAGKPLALIGAQHRVVRSVN